MGRPSGSVLAWFSAISSQVMSDLASVNGVADDVAMVDRDRGPPQSGVGKITDLEP